MTNVSFYISPLIEGVWNGALVHLEGIDVIGPTAGSFARLVQDREMELWEGTRIVGGAEAEEVLSKSSPPIATRRQANSITRKQYS